MFGYIAPLKSELKIREFEVYNAYYCAVCRAVKKRYGELPRLILSYDAAFIAMLMDSLTGGDESLRFETFRCFNNPLKKRNVVFETAAVDYAADVMVLLGWYNLRDKKNDRDEENPLKASAVFLGEAALKSAGRRAAERLGEKAKICQDCMDEQATLEKANTAELDRAADPTGKIMAELLDFPGASEFSDILRSLGYHLGRYIYMIDAADDLEKDMRHDAYNPLRLKPIETNALRTAISLDLARLGELLDELPLVYHKDIIDNIIYLGLFAKLDEVIPSGKPQ